MYPEYNMCPLNQRVSEEQVEQFLHPLLLCLDPVLDRRLVRTFVQAVTSGRLFPRPSFFQTAHPLALRSASSKIRG